MTYAISLMKKKIVRTLKGAKIWGYEQQTHAVFSLAIVHSYLEFKLHYFEPQLSTHHR